MKSGAECHVRLLPHGVLPRGEASPISHPMCRTHRVGLLLFAALSLTGSVNAQVVTVSGTGTVEGWRTFVGGTVTPGAPAVLEAAFPAGQPFTATFTYDTTQVFVGNSVAPTSRFYRGDLITSMSIQISSGRTITPDPASVLGSTWSQIYIFDEPLADYVVGSRDMVIDGSKTFAGYTVVFGNIGITDFDATALPNTDLPNAVCLGEWEELDFSFSVQEGEAPDTVLYQLRGVGTPDRSIDSDGDGLSDGTELGSGTNPCNADTDGDGLNDGLDPNPLIPQTSTDVLAGAVRDTATGVLEIPEGSFAGPNANAQRGRRNALANQLQSAANAIESRNLEEALSILEHVLDRLDGDPVPPDAMEDGPAKDALRQEVEALLALVRAEVTG
jgi:hypothetical protein